MKYATLFVFFLLYAAVCNAAIKQKSKSVTTLIDAKWEISPLVLEISEYLADENVDFFWSFIDEISRLDPPLADLTTDKERYDMAIAVAEKMISSSLLSVLKFSLSLHIYSPKVEMYSHMATERGVTNTKCPAVSDVAGKLTCSVSELETLISQAKEKKHSMEVFDIDHQYPGSENNTVSVILYGEVGTPEFTIFHNTLRKLALAGTVNYVLRHYVKERQERRVRLSGYGVELQIKSTEYKAQDDSTVKGDGSVDSGEQDEEEEEVEGFDFNKLKTLYPDKIENLDQLRQHLLESSSDMAPLKVWQVQELSLQAAARIVAAPKEEVFKVMTNIAQNFPLQAKSLIKTHVTEDLKKEVKKNQERFSTILNIQPVDTALFLNGMFFDLDVTDVISLLEVVRQESRVMNGLHKIGISNSEMSSLMAIDFSHSSSSEEYAIDIRDSAVMWINDIENDKQYRRWSDSLLDLLRPTFPGMMRSIRRNMYNLIILANPAKNEVRPLLRLIESFYLNNAPIRIGLVFSVSPDEQVSGLEDAGVALLNAFNYISETKDAYSGLSFITDVYASVKESRDITIEDITKIFLKKYSADIEEVMGRDSDYNTGRQLASEFVEKSGFKNTPQVLVNGVPIPEKLLNVDDFEDAVLTEIMTQTPGLQKAIYKGELTDGDIVIDFLMSKPHVMPRLNSRILNQEKPKFLDMLGNADSWASQDIEAFIALPSRDKTAVMIRDLEYFSARKHASDNTYILTYWVVADLETASGRNFVKEALEQMQASGNARIALIINSLSTRGESLLNKLALAVLKTLSPDQATTYMIKILSDESLSTAISSGEKDPSDISIQKIDLSKLSEAWKNDATNDKSHLHIYASYCRSVLGLSPGSRTVIVNGHILGQLEENEKFGLNDFALLERYNMNNYGEKIHNTIKKEFKDDENSVDSDTLMRASALLVSRPQSRSRFTIPFSGNQHSMVNLPPQSPEEPAFDMTVILDPVSRGAQKVGPILSVLQEVVNCDIKIFLNCAEKHSDMPLKSFYRYVLEPEVQFTPEGHVSSGPIARFINIPPDSLFTQNMHVPENWLVESVRSPYDLDNIKLEDVDSTVHSEYELEYLLLEGHCFDATTGNPPRGLQITLGTESRPVIKDTIVMANLGYFQLKANPGEWLLRLREGRSSDIYEIASHEGTDTPDNSSDIKVLISSFRSHVIKLKVNKKPGKAQFDLLSEEEDEKPGLWNSIASTFGHSSKEEDDKEEKINIFSLASGHLYERFLRIMMLSVVKHTKTPVKFWFLKNYLSPTLKDFLPYMAKEYKFEYELVQYKWPRWLHQQTEKQRIIWGYKILFLDVLFPLDVKKIIFVDADQVVRADMKELVELDLGGAPYGYTPFCDSRKEMDGFRFWKQGYWRNHLQHRRYHISALYIVDLRRFRKIAAGDRLRGQYQALSQDPNSLSNLDQDLPNNMIHQVAIKSLPQEWLWCETWCDDDSKKYAKTIDLCNNPLTKEAKLTAAMRIIDEWKDYDEEIKQLQIKIDNMRLEDYTEVPPSETHEPHSEL